jgi:hypothetical protein
MDRPEFHRLGGIRLTPVWQFNEPFERTAFEVGEIPAAVENGGAEPGPRFS